MQLLHAVLMGQTCSIRVFRHAHVLVVVYARVLALVDCEHAVLLGLGGLQTCVLKQVAHVRVVTTFLRALLIRVSG